METPAHTAPIKSPDYAQHASILGQLTNRRIDAYTLKGAYGADKQQRMLNDIRAGKYNGLNARIRKGEFGSEANRALKEADLNREARKRDKASPPLTIDQQELMRQILAESGYDIMLPTKG